MLAHLIELLSPGSIDLSKLKYTHSSVFEVTGNLNICIKAATKNLKGLGVVVVNIGANDFIEHNVDIVLGLGSPILLGIA